jgi:hypothetical protein
MLSELSLIAHRVNAAVSFADPIHYEDAKETRRLVEKSHAFTRVIGSIDPLVYEGREILLNVRSNIHFDRQDPKRSFAAMVALGYHKGGYLVLPELGLRIRLEPGDIVLIRGRMLRHFVEDWEGGQRICVPHFTHSSVWRMLKRGHLVGIEDFSEDEEYFTDEDEEYFTDDDEEWDDEEEMAA